MRVLDVHFFETIRCLKAVSDSVSAAEMRGQAHVTASGIYYRRSPGVFICLQQPLSSSARDYGDEDVMFTVSS